MTLNELIHKAAKENNYNEFKKLVELKNKTVTTILINSILINKLKEYRGY